jgi:anti-sigma-K factor RskA
MDIEGNRALLAAALARMPAGDRTALQTVYRLTSAKLFGLCLHVLGERGEAEDMLQDVYATVWRQAAYFDAARASPMAWLIAIGRDAAAARAAREPAFAAMAAAWEERLAPGASEIEEIAPPPQLWTRIVADLPAPVPRHPGLWRDLAFWRGLTLVSGVLAAASLSALAHIGVAKPPPPLIASIDSDGIHHFIVTVDPQHGTIAVMPASFAAVPGKVPELWLIPPGGKPHSLGLLPVGHMVTLALPPNLIADAIPKAVVVISLEPPGGSLTGQPTGPVIATGELTTL